MLTVFVVDDESMKPKLYSVKGQQNREYSEDDRQKKTSNYTSYIVIYFLCVPW